MIRIIISKDKNPEMSLLALKKAASFTLRKYRKGFYFHSKKKKI